MWCASGSALCVSKHRKALEFVQGPTWLTNYLKSDILSPSLPPLGVFSLEIHNRCQPRIYWWKPNCLHSTLAVLHKLNNSDHHWFLQRFLLVWHIAVRKGDFSPQTSVLLALEQQTAISIWCPQGLISNILILECKLFSWSFPLQ